MEEVWEWGEGREREGAREGRERQDGMRQQECTSGEGRLIVGDSRRGRGDA